MGKMLVGIEYDPTKVVHQEDGLIILDLTEVYTNYAHVCVLSSVPQANDPKEWKELPAKSRKTMYVNQNGTIHK